jgi:hypothetical protein
MGIDFSSFFSIVFWNKFVIAIRPILHSWLITGFVGRVAWWEQYVQQELPTSPVHMTSPPVLSGVRVIWSLVLCVLFCISLFVLYLMAIVLYALPRITAYYYIFYWNNAEFACVIKAKFAACYLPPGRISRSRADNKGNMKKAMY